MGPVQRKAHLRCRCKQSHTHRKTDQHICDACQSADENAGTLSGNQSIKMFAEIEIESEIRRGISEAFVCSSRFSMLDRGKIPRQCLRY